MAAHENLNQGQFEHHLNEFKKQTGVELLGRHAIINDRVVPTVRQELTVKQKDEKSAYILDAAVMGEEGNLHGLMVHTFGDKPFYGLALSKNVRKENLDTHDLSEFSTKLDTHLNKAINTPPSTEPIPNHPLTELGFNTSDAATTSMYLDEWNRTGRLSSVQITDYDANKSTIKLYDPLSEKYISGSPPLRRNTE